jgi:hypothetical protein
MIPIAVANLADATFDLVPGADGASVRITGTGSGPVQISFTLSLPILQRLIVAVRLKQPEVGMSLQEPKAYFGPVEVFETGKGE